MSLTNAIEINCINDPIQGRIFNRKTMSFCMKNYHYFKARANFSGFRIPSNKPKSYSENEV